MQRVISRFLGIEASSADAPALTNGNVGQGNAVPGGDQETTPKKLSARERLDGLSGFRIPVDAITFSSERSGGSGGKADVVPATFNRRKWSRKRVVAVKKLRCSGALQQPKFSREFVHEVDLMAGLSHENIVQFIGFVEDLENGKAWIVLSWEPNGNVSEFLATGKWEIPERVSLIKDTLEGVKYLHTRQPSICHGDLKSFNILVSSSYRAIITDFGSARAVTELEPGVRDEELDRQTQRNPTTAQAPRQIHISTVGNQLTLTGPAWSLRWAPPEVVSGERPGLSTDIWAAGWICWEIMTGQLPFPEVSSAGAITLMVIQGEVPSTHENAQLAQIITLCSLMKDCWAFDPKARPDIARSCSELQWIPSLPPSGGNVSDRRVSSIELLLKMGRTHYMQARLEIAASLFQEALSLARSAGNQTATAKASSFLGDVYQVQSKFTQAEKSYMVALEAYVGVGDDPHRATTLHALGEVYRLQAKTTQAEESYTQAYKIYTRLGSDLGRANTLRGLGDLCRVQYKFTQAEELYTQAHEIYNLTGNDRGRANTLNGLGEVSRVQFNFTQAEELLTQAQEIYVRIGDDLGRANVLCNFGHLRQAQHRNAEAALHFGEAKDLYAQIGSTSEEEDAARLLAAVSPNSSTP